MVGVREQPKGKNMEPTTSTRTLFEVTSSPAPFTGLQSGSAGQTPECISCSQPHTRADTRAVGVFSFDRPQFTATYPGAPLKATRGEAQQDMCQHRQERNAAPLAVAA